MKNGTLNRRLLGLVVAILIVGSSCNTDKIRFVENHKIFNEFKGTKELKKRNDDILIPKKNRIDSLTMLINNAEVVLNNPVVSKKEKENIVQEYIYHRNLYDSLAINYEKLLKEIDYVTQQQLWNKINQYMIDYGKEHQMDLILGAAGDGNIMFADERINLTEEVLKYMNEKYEGM